MQYRLETDIDRPRDAVVALFLDVAHLKKWQPELVSIETIEGSDPTALGAKTRQVHKMGKREMTMIQTITEHDAPERFSATYEAGKVWNLVENSFTERSDGGTHWVVDNTFRCGGVVRLLAMLFPGMFRKQTRIYMERFKTYAERTL